MRLKRGLLYNFSLFKLVNTHHMDKIRGVFSNILRNPCDFFCHSLQWYIILRPKLHREPMRRFSFRMIKNKNQSLFFNQRHIFQLSFGGGRFSLNISSGTSSLGIEAETMKRASKPFFCNRPFREIGSYMWTNGTGNGRFSIQSSESD